MQFHVITFGLHLCRLDYLFDSIHAIPKFKWVCILPFLFACRTMVDRTASGSDYRNAQGFQQQLAAFNKANIPKPSKLVSHCIDKWGFGNDAFSACEIQQIMQAAVEDGCHHPEVELLQTIGCNGKHPQNCDRDM